MRKRMGCFERARIYSCRNLRKRFRGFSPEKRKRMGSGDPPGLQNRRAAGLPCRWCVRLAHASARKTSPQINADHADMEKNQMLSGFISKIRKTAQVRLAHASA